MTGTVDPLETVEPNVARMYVCGITPYDVGHLGHALTFVVFDTVHRYLEFCSYEVLHVQNITDIDDDMIRKAKELGTDIPTLTDRNHSIYLAEMDALNVQRPMAFPRVSESIPQIIELVQSLIDNGHAYVVDGYVFFDATSAPRFGALNQRTLEQLRTDPPKSDSIPSEPAHLKRDPLDFLLWQPCTEADAHWDSPWGEGRPGWHVECSAMVRATLGNRIDIHGGGKDLRYPHHESEIVQSECASGEAPYVGTWMHIGTLMLDGVKMSKSLGNLVKVSELLTEGHSPDAIRLGLLGTHYRADHDWSNDELEGWERKASLLRTALHAPGGGPDRLRVESRRLEFMDAMDDDFDTPAAIEILVRIAEDIIAGQLDATTAKPTLVELADVLGLRLGREG
ncbi:MAG: cysteine--tRNA ligase [Chloroflexi bacterium]|nr:MAG: cysteine--tRNA ligase [Chloroflexota bacterium]